MSDAITAIGRGTWATIDRVRLFAVVIIASSLVMLVVRWTGGSGLMDRFGHPIATDFSGLYTAGRMVVEGNAVGAYDPDTHIAFQRRFHGSETVDVYGWHYPPFFLAVVAILALMPYLLALFVWQAATLGLLLQSLRMILPGQRMLVPAALAFPSVFLTVLHGHNAFLTASLMGFGLVLLDRRPLLAGLAIGLLAYKPQFGIVLPLVLVLGGHWRATAAAAATVVALAMLSTVLFGADIWHAFLQGAEFTRAIVLEEGSTGWHKIQSVFAAVRSWGGGTQLAYGVQAVASLAVMGCLAALVLRRADQRLVAAATAVGALLATPYVLDYDLTVLGIAIAFLVAYGREQGFRPFEASLLAAVWLILPLARNGAQATGIPIGLIILGAVFAHAVARGLAATADSRAPQLSGAA